MTRFDDFMKQAKKPRSQDSQSPDVQTSERLNAQTPEQPNISTSKAKSSSKDYVRTTVYLTKDLHKRLKMGSLEHELEMSDIAEEAIAQWLDEHSDA